MIEHYLTKYGTDEGRFAMSWLQEEGKPEKAFSIKVIKLNEEINNIKEKGE